MINDINFIEWKAEVAKQMILRGWKMRDLAEVTNYGREYLYAVTNGKQIGQPAVDKISEVLGIDPYQYPKGACWLIGGSRDA